MEISIDQSKGADMQYPRIQPHIPGELYLKKHERLNGHMESVLTGATHNMRHNICEHISDMLRGEDSSTRPFHHLNIWTDLNSNI